ncbi:Prp18-domain-containing protein [Terfezia boudieri ATCC MYA-4762]|uniref:Pre-mRNA-splicing factor 18 n=1 Tax=Terfezia boudieri ATCC MYA-4762 TaxID=1051890 RepID=A0A3N4LFF7_9PEZI|nr:Prp18-domain-containing protein [Terfezia boudieri ATCC MYA-4762]
MDFASILSSEIKKRKTSPPPATSSVKKYLKRSDLESARQAEYHASQTRLEAERAEKAAQKRQLEQEEEARQEALREKKRRLAEESRRKREDEEAGRLGKSKKKGEGPRKDGDVDGDGGKEETPIPAEEEVLARLRKLKQPIRLFGETPLQRIKRLHKLERASSPRTKPTQAPLTESEMQLTLADITANPTKVYMQLLSWFRLVLIEWDLTLSSRPLSVRQSYSGKAATNAYVQAQSYMGPLFKLLEKQDLHPDIFPKVCEIVYYAQQRKYVTANDVYLRLSIGNAAWPIGVTMVGIHERSAREKLHEKGMAAHIMSDEITRKYLQSIKRCLKFCQVRWPPEDQLQLMG